MTEFVNRVPVKPGDVYFVDAGMIHAIGAGCMLLEVQEPTDFTIQPEYWCGDYHLNDQEMYLSLNKDTALDCFHFGLYSADVAAKAKKEPRETYRDAHALLERFLRETAIAMTGSAPDCCKMKVLRQSSFWSKQAPPGEALGVAHGFGHGGQPGAEGGKLRLLSGCGVGFQLGKLGFHFLHGLMIREGGDPFPVPLPIRPAPVGQVSGPFPFSRLCQGSRLPQILGQRSVELSEGNPQEDSHGQYHRQTSDSHPKPLHVAPSFFSHSTRSESSTVSSHVFSTVVSCSCSTERSHFSSRRATRRLSRYR